MLQIVDLIILYKFYDSGFIWILLAISGLFAISISTNEIIFWLLFIYKLRR